MNPTLRGTIVIGGSLALMAAIGLLSAPSSSAQPANLNGDKGEAGTRFEGCKSCHRPALEEDRPQDIALYSEYPTWRDEDYHACAYEVLSGALGRQMNTLLKPYRPEGYDVRTDTACLACHATYYGTTPQDAPVVGDFFTENGVQCEACHGTTGEWPAKHGLKPIEWRKNTAAEKSKFGFVDLRDPATRAAKCASCHVGNADENKFVTHEMYAAGHPPLPAFELLSFSHDEPMHWRLPEYVPHIQDLAAKDPEKAWANYHYAKNNSQEARLLAAGATVAMRETVRLGAAEAKKTDGQLLDFALFDCYACHHDLRADSPRQKYGYNGVAGRPVMRGTATLLRAVAANVDPALAVAMDEKLAKVRRAYDAKPFGDPKAIEVAGAEFVKWTDEALKAIDEKKYDDQAVRALIDAVVAAGKAIPTDVKREPFDPEAARAVASAFNRLTQIQVESKDGKYAPIFGDRTKIGPALEDLATLTRINIRSDRKRQPCKAGGPVLATLGDRLKLLYEYEPVKVGESFLKIGGLLGEK